MKQKEGTRMKSNKYYEKRNELIKADRLSGMSGVDVAKKYGLKPQYVYKITRGLIHNDNPTTRETVTNLYNAGKTIDEIQNITGKDRNIIIRIVHELRLMSGDIDISDCDIPVKYRSRDRRSFRRITYQGTRYIDVTDFILENNDLTEARFN